MATESGAESGKEPVSELIDDLIRELMKESSHSPKDAHIEQDPLGAILGEAAVTSLTRPTSGTSMFERLLMSQAIASALAESLAPALARALTPEIMKAFGHVSGTDQPRKQSSGGSQHKARQSGGSRS